MDRLEQLRAFVRVVESGSFTATAAELGVGQPAISRGVSALEQRLGSRLLHRSTRGLSLTEEGERVYERALRVVEELDALAGDVRAPTRRRIRVAAPSAFGTLRLVANLAAFTEAAAVDVDVRLTDSFVDLIEDGIDVAFRFGTLQPSTAKARKLGMMPRIVVGSRGYLKKHGAPKRLDDLAEQRCVVRGADTRWAFVGAVRDVAPSLRVDNYLALRAAVLAGAGLGLAGTVVFYDGRRLHRDLRIVLPNHAVPPMPVHLVFRGDPFLPARVRSFIDWAVAMMKREPWLET